MVLRHGKLAIDGDRGRAITTETIRQIFEVDVTIDYTDGGVPFLLPQTMRPVAQNLIDSRLTALAHAYPTPSHVRHKTVGRL